MRDVDFVQGIDVFYGGGIVHPHLFFDAIWRKAAFFKAYSGNLI